MYTSTFTLEKFETNASVYINNRSSHLCNVIHRMKHGLFKNEITIS